MIADELCEVMPIIEKAAPIVASLIKNEKVSILVGLLGMLVNCNPNDQNELVKKLSNDNDLYAKMKNLESTHSEWLKKL
jgi:hypothetical protein